MEWESHSHLGGVGLQRLFLGIAAGFGLSAVFAFLFFRLCLPPGVNLSGEWHVPGVEQPLSFDELHSRFDGQTLAFSFSSSLPEGGSEELLLFLSRPLDFTVYLDGQPLTAQLFSNAFSVNLTTSFVTISLPQNAGAQRNDLVIHFQGLLPYHRNFMKLVLASQNEVLLYQQRLRFVNADFSRYAVGAILLLGFILLGLSKNLEGQRRTGYRRIGLAMFFYAGVLLFTLVSFDPREFPGGFVFYLGSTTAIVLLSKGMGAWLSPTPSFAAKWWWLLPLFSFLLLVPGWYSPFLLVLFNLLVLFQFVVLILVSYRSRSISPVILSFVLGCLVYQAGFYSILVSRFPLLPIIRDHAIFVLVFTLGYKVVRDYVELFRSEKEQRKELQQANLQLEFTHAELEEAYGQQELTLSRLQRLVQLSGRMASSSVQDTRTFLFDILEMTRELLPESDCYMVYFKEDTQWVPLFLDCTTRQLNQAFSDFSIQESEGVYLLEHSPGSLSETHHLLQQKLPVPLPPLQRFFIRELNVRNKTTGALLLGNQSATNVAPPPKTLEVLRGLGSMASSFFAFQQASQMQENFQTEIIRAIVRILELHDTYTRGHSEHVANLSREIAKHMDFSSEEVKRIYWVGLVHDIGKILVPDPILNKPARLTEEEFSRIKMHTVWGYEVLRESEHIGDMALGVKYHHERFDGKGYPDGLSGETIPLVARIIAVADTWDAMVRDRAYRKALSPSAAREELEKNKGSQFDPRIVEVFVKVLGEQAEERASYPGT